MNQFERVKAAVTLRQAAKAYGLRVLPNGMTCCPFHEDKHPSLKLNEDYFFCFGCGASGDIIDFTARLFGLSPYAAAKKLETDFGIGAEHGSLTFPTHAEPTRDRERLCICVLRDYLRQLRIWQLRYRPEKLGDKLHPRFAEAMKALSTVNHLLDCLLGNDLLLAKETAEVLCREGYIQRLSEYLGTLSVKGENAHERYAGVAG
ncbi:MAG: CHC2 zinc finger domain-containing protein [Candidatus Faecousia sp.]|nr:CHC2 zinc finger domain-containing protein [Candidatus Faecousia sp.]